MSCKFVVYAKFTRDTNRRERTLLPKFRAQKRCSVILFQNYQELDKKADLARST